MAYTNYPGPPDVNVMIQRSQTVPQNVETQFYPVFVGTGITARNKAITKSNLRADVTAFPIVKLTFDLLGDINTSLFKQTTFTIGQVVVTKSSALPDGSTSVTLDETTGYTVVNDVTIQSGDSTAYVTLNILSADVTAADIIYELNVTASNTDNDFDIRSIGAEDRFFSKDLFGPIVIEENDEQFFNDIAIAAEIAFRLEVPRFCYLEVPRDFGSAATADDFKNTIEKIYFNKDLYRIIPLTSDPDVINDLNTFISGIANPFDKRETVGFVTYDATKITNINDIDELVTKVGGFSESLNNKRLCNVFAGSSADFTIDGETYVLPQYFIAAAVAALDTTVGLVDPLSRRAIDIFDSIDGPRFRPKIWNMLAQKGVFIIQKDNETEPAIIRHQLTTAQSDNASDQEYSVVKNWDVVTKKIRDRLLPYAGENNIDAGYTERLDGTTTTVIQEILDQKLAKALSVFTPWSQSTNGDVRNLVTILKMDPVYPANELDVYIIV